MKEVENTISLYNAILRIIDNWERTRDESGTKMELSILRNSIGRKYEESPDVWPIVFSMIPEKFLGKGDATYEEKAIFLTLQLYSLGQQGSKEKRIRNYNKKYFDMGKSLSQLRTDDSVALDKRFNRIITAKTFDAFAFHLIQIFKVAKSKEALIVNFPQLCEDLLWLQMDKSKSICLKWAKSYYREWPEKNDNIVR